MPKDLTSEQYNYTVFSQANHELLDNWDSSPAVGGAGPDFPLLALDGGGETTLHALCREHTFLVVEFGSIT